MKILDSFDVYFLVMMIIQGTIIFTLDAKSFKDSNMPVTSKKSRILGGSVIIITIMLFALRAVL